MPSSVRRIAVIDSHTAGEPTRVIVSGGPDLGSGDVRQKLELLRTRHDDLRVSVIAEPRGSDVIVGALLCEPAQPSSAAAVIFFNDVGYLGMCGHGTIGVVTTLAHMGRIGPGRHTIETPVGCVVAELHTDGSVSFDNVPSYLHQANVALDVPGYGSVCGEVAWGGNWFFLVSDHGLTLEAMHRDQLMALSIAIRNALATAGITGMHGALIDHIELCGPPALPENSGRNFVLCPGTAFDRSPCGTGTSAKLAALYATGKLGLNMPWRQEGILGTVFEGVIRAEKDGCVIPTISGQAWIIAESTLLFDATDPFVTGIVF
jgi:4-hydroxyproline epimerase